MKLEDFSRSIDRLRPEIERRYPLTLGAIAPSSLTGDDGWRPAFTVRVDRYDSLSLLDLAVLEDWISTETGQSVLVEVGSVVEAAVAQGAAE